MEIKTFNPVGVPIEKEYQATGPMTLTITTWDYQEFKLYADAYKGKAAFRFNGVLKYVFQDRQEYVDNAEKMVYDHNISSKVSINGTEAWILRGTKQHKGGGFLTDMLPKAYKGYPLELALLLPYSDEEGYFYLYLDGEGQHAPNEPMIITLDANKFHRVEVEIAKGGEVVERYNWDGGLAPWGEPELISNSTIFTMDKVLFIPGEDPQGAPIPAHPFYVRWINQYGGYDYWMFACKQRGTLALESIDTYEAYESQGERTLLAHEASDQVQVSTGNISREEAEAIKYILRSPQVTWWNEEEEAWVKIHPAQGTKITWASDQALGEIQMTFEKPRPTTIL